MEAGSVPRISISIETRVQIASGNVFCRLGNEIVILNVTEGVYYGVNGVGATVWDHLQSPCSLEELAGIVMQEYAVDAESCQRDLQELVGGLIDSGLLRIVA